MSQGIYDRLDGVISRNLLRARRRAGLTQNDLALAARISRATIAQLESGQSDPRLSTLIQLATALGITPLALLSIEPPTSHHQEKLS